MFGFFKPKQAEVLQHWIAFAEGFQLSSSEFYDSVEKELKVREVPGLEINRVEFAEGGILSAKRIYMRMMRERLVFDVCAAPFGKTFFFSCRFAEIPAVIQLWQLVVMLFAVSVITYLMWRTVGIILGSLILFILLGFLVYTLRNAVALGLRDLDAALVKSPLFGPLYERLLRKETYYRHDTRLMYLEIVSSVVKQLAEDATAQKGVKLTRQYEQAPVFGELYKLVSPKPKAESPNT